MSEPFRAGDRLPSLEVKAFTRDGFINFPVTFPGGVTFRMVGGGRVVTGTASGDALGTIVYNWAAGDLSVAGTYAAVFIATDGAGRTATFPTGTNLELVVVPMI